MAWNLRGALLENEAFESARLIKDIDESTPHRLG